MSGSAAWATAAASAASSAATAACCSESCASADFGISPHASVPATINNGSRSFQRSKSIWSSHGTSLPFQKVNTAPALCRAIECVGLRRRGHCGVGSRAAIDVHVSRRTAFLRADGTEQGRGIRIVFRQTQTRLSCGHFDQPQNSKLSPRDRRCRGTSRHKLIVSECRMQSRFEKRISIRPCKSQDLQGSMDNSVRERWARG